MVGLGFLAAIFGGVGWPGLNIFYGKVVDRFVKFERDRDNATSHHQPTEQIVSDFLSDVYVMAGIMASIAAIYVIGNYVAIHCFQLFSLRQSREIKKRYFWSILKQEIAWYDCQSSGEFASRISR